MIIKISYLIFLKQTYSTNDIHIKKQFYLFFILDIYLFIN